MPRRYDGRVLEHFGSPIRYTGMRLRRGGHAVQSDRTYAVTKTEDEWRQELSSEEYAVLRQAGTERPWSGEYNDTKTPGIYSCRACDAELFTADAKFDSH